MPRVPYPNLLGALALVATAWLARAPGVALVLPAAAAVLLCAGGWLHLRGQGEGVPTLGRWLVATALAGLLSAATVFV